MEIIALTFPVAKEQPPQVLAEAEELLYTEATTHSWLATCRQRINAEENHRKSPQAQPLKLVKKKKKKIEHMLGKLPNAFSQKAMPAQRSCISNEGKFLASHTPRDIICSLGFV